MPFLAHALTQRMSKWQGFTRYIWILKWFCFRIAIGLVKSLGFPFGAEYTVARHKLPGRPMSV